MRSVALDLGVKETSFCEVVRGLVVARRTVRDLAGLEDVLGPRSKRAHVAIEACREAWHVHDVLSAWGHEVVLVDTTRTKQLGIRYHGRKTDRIDAELLARAVEQGGIPVAHVLSPARRKLRDVLGVRRALVETRAQYITTIRGLARSRGNRVGTCAPEYFLVTLASCQLFAIEPWSYLRDVFCLLQHWPEHALLDLAPLNWNKTRERDDVCTLLNQNPFRTLTLDSRG